MTLSRLCSTPSLYAVQPWNKFAKYAYQHSNEVFLLHTRSKGNIHQKFMDLFTAWPKAIWIKLKKNRPKLQQYKRLWPWGSLSTKIKSYPTVPKVTSKCEHCDVRLTSLKTVFENLMNNLFVTSKKRILQFMNLKCCKISLKSKNKKMFVKLINKN